MNDKRFPFNYFIPSVLTILLVCSSYSHIAKAQQLSANDNYNEYLQALAVSGIGTEAVNPFLFVDQRDFFWRSLDTLEQHPWVNLPATVLQTSTSEKRFTFAPHDPKLRSYWQSLEPGGHHDGPVWQGRGFTTDFSAGFFVRYGILSASLRPHIIYNQNRSFELSPYEPNTDRSQFAYPLGNIDWPQRFGNGPFWSFDIGNSYIRADYKGWAAGISNELMQWGPARQNSILMDSNAPGFRHFFISTSQPKDIHIGLLKTKLFWGKMFESDFFDDNSLNNERYISGLTLSVNPKPLPGLRLGINRIFYETIPPNGIPPGDLLKIFEAFTKVNFTNDSNPGGNDQADQLLSLFGRWIFPNSGLEIYGEWARTDHSWNWREFFTEPEHSRGYTLGLQKTFKLSTERIFSSTLEFTQLEASKTGLFRGFPTFYVHGRSHQGYTNRGQLLGAAIGPGSSSQYIDGALFFDKGSIKLFAQRVAQNNDFLYQSDEMFGDEIQSLDENKYWLHNVEMRFGASLLYFYKQFEAGIGFIYRRELNDDYIYKNDKNHLGISMSIRYRLSDLR